MTDEYFQSLLIVGGVCIGFALHSASLAGRANQRRHLHLLLLALLEAAYCIVALRYLRMVDEGLARPWGQAICAFTPYITFLFGELTMELAEQRPRWLVRLQKTNLVLTTMFSIGVVIDMLRGTSLMVRPYLATDLSSVHRHQVVFTPLGLTYLAWVSIAFTSFAFILFRRYRTRRDLLPMLLGCVGYFIATMLDFGILIGVRDGIFLQHFGFFALVVGCWRVLSNRFEDALADMEQAVKRLEDQRTRLLVAAPMLHKQKLDSLGTLAAGVAHEINNPIQGIMNYAQLLKRDLDAESPAAEFADEIARESRRVADIVRSLLRFGRSDGSLIVAANIGEILDGTLTLIRTGLVHEEISLRVNVEKGMPEMSCRAAQLQQVIMNLVTNARDAILRRNPARTDAREISIDVRRRDRDGDVWIELTVSDTGDGLDPALRERIFDPFFTTKGPEGTGLGLSVSHGIVQTHGGTISCESQPGRGASFFIDIPARGKIMMLRSSGMIVAAPAVTPPADAE